MEVRAGLTYVPHMAQLVGLVDGPVSEKEVNLRDWNEGQTKASLVTKAFEVFFVSTDGKACVPVGFAGTSGISGDDMMKLLVPLMEIFKKNGIDIEWGSSDGFSSNMKFIAAMKKAGSNYLHFFDPSHILKNLRSVVEDHTIITVLYPGGFSLRTLDVARKQFPALQKVLPDTLFPTDRMDIDHYKALIKKEVLEELAKCPGEAERGMLEYLSRMSDFHRGFLDNQVPWSKRVTMLQKANEYFTALSKKVSDSNAPLTTNLAFQITTSIESLTSLYRKHSTNLKPSVYGTLVVENFFSCVRRKVRSPSFYEFALFHVDSFQELVKKFSGDYVFKSQKKKPGKVYGAQEGIEFSIKSIGWVSSKEKKEVYMKMRERSGGDEGQRKMCKELAQLFRCSRKKLLIRETTCKESAFGNKIKLR